MGDEGEYWRDVKPFYNERFDARRLRNMDKAQQSEIDWTKHTRYHWSHMLNGERLDYWPSRNRFRYKGKTMVGDVEGFIKNRSVETAP